MLLAASLHWWRGHIWTKLCRQGPFQGGSSTVARRFAYSLALLVVVCRVGALLDEQAEAIPWTQHGLNVTKDACSLHTCTVNRETWNWQTPGTAVVCNDWSGGATKPLQLVVASRALVSCLTELPVSAPHSCDRVQPDFGSSRGIIKWLRKLETTCTATLN